MSCFWTRCTNQEIFLKAVFRRQGSMHQSWVIFPHLRQGWTGVSPFLPVLISLILLHSVQDKSATLAELSSPISHPAESVKTSGHDSSFAPICSTPLKGFPKHHWNSPSPRTARLCPQRVTPASHKTTGGSSPSIPECTVRAPRKIQHGLAPWGKCSQVTKKTGPVSRSS